jgi:hydrogenase maturation protease
MMSNDGCAGGVLLTPHSSPLTPKPILIFGYGNPSRGDDALAPELLLRLEERLDASSPVELLTDFQLQPEHALDLLGRERVLFVDASASGPAIRFTRLKAASDASYTTHAMSPAAILAVFEAVQKVPAPPCYLLALRGESFELGEGLSAAARSNLQQGLDLAGRLLNNPDWDSFLREQVE